MYVRVYSGVGADDTSIHMLLHALTRSCAEYYEVTTISAEEIIAGGWQQHTALLAIGGGFDAGYQRALGPDGIAQIHDYVLSGGKYLGICAGAYFGCRKIVFDEGGPLQVIGSSRLSFFNGECTGPAVPGFQYTDQSGAHAVTVNWCLKDTALEDSSDIHTVHNHPKHSTNALYESASIQWPLRVRCYLNGGGYFKADSTVDGSSTRFNVLARYTNLDGKPVAAVQCFPGKGAAILSSLHIEYNPEEMDSNDPYVKRFLPELLADRKQSYFCFSQMLKLLNIEVHQT